MQYNCWKALDDRECRYVRLFAMDFAKAFDNVKHSILSDKLKALNLNPYITNWYLVNCPEASLSKYADDTTMQVVVNKAENDCASDVISQYLSWSSTNCMPCNLSKCKELVLKKKGQVNPSSIGNIVQVESLVLLGVTFQSNGRFTEHIKRKLLEANKYLYVLRSIRKEGYNQVEIDHLFQSLVLPKISYGLPVYAASTRA